MRKVQDINAGSTADIAFLLLIFFLVTTTMDTDKGLQIVLPPITPTVQTVPTIEKNVLEVMINANDRLMVERKPLKVTELTELTRVFITNNNRNPLYSESPQKAVVSLKSDRGTSYDMYIKVHNEIKRAYNSLRAKKALSMFNIEYKALTNAQKREIELIYPIKISEAEPENVLGLD